MAVLWRRRWALALSLLVAVGLAVAYLFTATPIYRSTARLVIEQNAPRVHVASSQTPLYSEGFMQTQVDAIRSSAVLSRALKGRDVRGMRTFAGASGDPGEWLRKSGRLYVETVKRSDLVDVSLESPDASEATDLLTAIVDAHLADQLEQRRRTAADMLKALEHEKREVDAKRSKVQEEMNAHQRKQGVVTFADNKSNDVVERTATLAASLSKAQIAVVELRARKAAMAKALEDPVSRSAFVSTQLAKSKEGSDREYDELRTLLVQSEIMLSISRVTQAGDNRAVQAQQARLDSLREQIADKEIRVAEAHLVELATQLAAAEEEVKQFRTELDAQQKLAMEFTLAGADHAKFAAEVDRLQKQSDLLGNRIVEVSVNSRDEAPLHVRVSEPARALQNPVKPRKALVLLGALLVGWVAGLGLVMLREWRDARVTSPDEILGLTGAPVLGLIPRINNKLASADRGQLVQLDMRSPAAEAFRAIRTSLQFGPASQHKTIVVTSATPGDGKSTTASNLAIAFAQAGERTLIVDCDLRQPVQHRIFDVDGTVGLTDVLAGEAKLSGALCATETKGLYVLPAGPVAADPSEQLASKRFNAVMERLAGTFDRIIIDAPPAMMVADAQVLAASSDATLLVLRMNRTSRNIVTHARAALERVGANVLGAVANDVTARDADRYYGGSWAYPAAGAKTKRLAKAGAGETSSRRAAPPDARALMTKEPQPLGVEELELLEEEPQPGASGAH